MSIHDLVTLQRSEYEYSGIGGPIAIVTVGKIAIRWNKGGGRLSEPVYYPTSTKPVAMAIADFNRDGRLDIATADQPHQNASPPVSVPAAISVLLNDGFNRFRQPYRARLKLVSDPDEPIPYDLVAMDVDNDQWIDLVVARGPIASLNSFRTFLNTTVDPPFASPPLVQSLSFTPNVLLAGEVNGDAYPDLVSLQTSPGIPGVRVHWNTGSYSFGTIGPLSLAISGSPRAIALGWLDGDSLVDLAVGVPAEPNNVAVLFGDEQGSFSGTANDVYNSAPEGDPTDLVIIDATGDGFADIVALNDIAPLTNVPTVAPTSISVLPNDPAEPGRFVDKNVRLLPVSGTTHKAAVGRFGTLLGDLYADIASIAPDETLVASVVQNLGAGNMSPLTAISQGPLVVPVAAGVGKSDNDPNSPPDLHVANAGGGGNVVNVFYQTAAGVFSPTPNRTVGLPANPLYLAVGPVAGGTLDDFVITLSDYNVNFQYYKNNGGSYILQDEIDVGSNEVRQVVLADFDNDTDLDAAVVDSAPGVGAVRFLGNNAGASFTLDAWPALTGLSEPHALVACQVVGDGRPDVVVANTAANEVRIYRNDIGGVGDPFVLEQTLGVPGVPGTNPSPRSVACASDGSFIVTGNLNAAEATVFVNNAGTLLPGIRYGVGLEPTSVSVVDIDDDSDEDIVVANFRGDTLSILLNNGAYGFEEQRLIAAGENPTYVVNADVDGNGRPDLVNTGGGQPNTATTGFVRVTYSTCSCP